MSERVTELFAAEKPEYAEKLESIKARMEQAKGKLEEVRQRFDLTGAQHGNNAEELETRKLRWMLKMLAGAKMGVAMHMAKWGERLRHNKFVLHVSVVSCVTLATYLRVYLRAQHAVPNRERS